MVAQPIFYKQKILVRHSFYVGESYHYFVPLNRPPPKMRDLRSFTEFSFLLLNSLHLLKPAEEKLIFAVKEGQMPMQPINRKDASANFPPSYFFLSLFSLS